MFTTESIYGENGGGGDDATDVQTGRTVTTDGTHFCFPHLSPKKNKKISLRHKEKRIYARSELILIRQLFPLSLSAPAVNKSDVLSCLSSSGFPSTSVTTSAIKTWKPRPPTTCDDSPNCSFKRQHKVGIGHWRIKPIRGALHRGRLWIHVKFQSIPQNPAGKVCVSPSRS